VNFALVNALQQLAEQAATPGGMVALLAAALAGVLIVVSCFVKTILPLRLLAVGSNLGFMLYGVLAPSPMTFLLHVTLLPLNLVRAQQMLHLTRSVKRSLAAGAGADTWLKPYMKPRKLQPGQVLFSKGDPADQLYYLVDGAIELVELGLSLPTGRLFGEIAFFAPDRRRSATARCVSACTVLTISESTFTQLYYQNPAFGFEVVRLIAGRLSGDVQRLEQALARSRDGGPG
jgi:hypothetical protein